MLPRANYAWIKSLLTSGRRTGAYLGASYGARPMLTQCPLTSPRRLQCTLRAEEGSEMLRKRVTIKIIGVKYGASACWEARHDRTAVSTIAT